MPGSTGSFGDEFAFFVISGMSDISQPNFISPNAVPDVGPIDQTFG